MLPGQANCRGPTARDTRGFVKAVRRLGRAGVGWRDLPAYQATLVELLAKEAGRYEFTCGMGMLGGALVVK